MITSKPLRLSLSRPHLLSTVDYHDMTNVAVRNLWFMALIAGHLLLPQTFR